MQSGPRRAAGVNALQATGAANAVKAPPASRRQPLTHPNLQRTAFAEALWAWQRQSGLAAAPSRGSGPWQACCTCRCAADQTLKISARRERRYLGLLSHFFELVHIPGSLDVAGISTSVLHQGEQKITQPYLFICSIRSNCITLVCALLNQCFSVQPASSKAGRLQACSCSSSQQD